MQESRKPHLYVIWSTVWYQFTTLGECPLDYMDSYMLMLKLSLTHGVDPNSDVGDGRTDWRYILEEILEKTEANNKPRLFEAVKLLLRHAACFEQKCVITKGPIGFQENRVVKARELLRKAYDVDQFGVLEDIVKQRDMEK